MEESRRGVPTRRLKKMRGKEDDGKNGSEILVDEKGRKMWSVGCNHDGDEADEDTTKAGKGMGTKREGESEEGVGTTQQRLGEKAQSRNSRPSQDAAFSISFFGSGTRS